MARMARCTYFATCGKEVESSQAKADRAFFMDHGKGNLKATDTCAVCRYARMAHDRKAKTNELHLKNVCDTFISHGAYDHDEFYCGCKGWD